MAGFSSVFTMRFEDLLQLKISNTKFIATKEDKTIVIVESIGNFF